LELRFGPVGSVVGGRAPPKERHRRSSERLDLHVGASSSSA
jgi:hypothetical protein